MKKFRIVERTRFNGRKTYTVQTRYSGFKGFFSFTLFWDNDTSFETFEAAKQRHDELQDDVIVSSRNMWEVTKV